MAEITYYVALPIVAATTHVIGGWERDWTQIVGFNDTAGDPFLLFYKEGAAYAAPIVQGASGPQNGVPVLIDGFPVEGDGAWDQIAAFELNRKPFLLLYKQNRATLVAPAHKRRGAAVSSLPSSMV